MTFDVNRHLGSSDGLRIDAPVVDGSIFKIGDGIMTLSGTSSNEHSQTIISRGGNRAPACSNWRVPATIQ